MSKGTHRRVIAASMLAFCLVLAVPQTAEAAGPEGPGQRGQIERSLDGELTWWERLVQILDSLWAKSGVFIDPD